MRVLHVANFSLLKKDAVFYSIDKKISNGLIRNGHLVCDFSYRDISKKNRILGIKKIGINKMIKSLFSSINNVRPDLILLGHSELIDGSFLSLIREKYPNIKIAMWWVDPFDNISHIDIKLPYLDAFFATSSPGFYKDKFSNKTDFYFIPNVCDDSIETSKSFEKAVYDTDLIFLGRSNGNRKDFIDKLKKLENINFKIFGNTKNTLIFGQDFLDTISKSKMAINYSRYNKIPLYSSDRVIQLLAQGTLVFCPRIPCFEKLFTSEELVYYNSHDEERIEISTKGWEKAHNSYNSTRVTKFMVETIFKNSYSEDYEWTSQTIRCDK